LFIVEDRGEQTLKGLERPVQLYRAIRPSGMRGRFEAAAAAGGLTPFVGREDELRSLLSRWGRARDGEGQVVTISGEAGIGKSRLVRRFHEEIAASPHDWLQTGAGVFFQSTPFYPVTELIRQLTNRGSAGDPISQLESALGGVGLNPAEAIPLLAPLLTLPPSSAYPLSTMSPEQQRRRLLATLVEWLLRVARDRPLVAVIEDLHWVDPSTLELIQLLVEQGATAPLLLLYTARPEFRPPWPQRAHHLQLALDRLSARDVREIVGAVAADRALADETVATLVERTGGVPLFVEELTRAVLERGDAGREAHTIPATLHDSLMARLDRLGDAKELLQMGAVLGGEFSYELLRAVHQVNDQKLQEGLRSLTDAELLYVRGLPPDADYQFKHALIREAAYEALLKSRRKELHLAAARSIDNDFTSIKETHPEVLARHWTEADEQEPAIAAWQAAGDNAARRNAAREAAQHYLHAVELLPPIDDFRRSTLLLALGREQRRSGQTVEAHETFIRSGEIAEALGAVETVQQAATELVRLNFTVGLSGDAARRLLTGALTQVGPSDSVIRALILADLGRLMSLPGSLEQAAEYVEQGVAMSRRLGSPEALQYCLAAVADVYPERPQDLERRVACAKERLELFNTVISNQIQLYEDQFGEALSHLEESLTELGDMTGADATFKTWESFIDTHPNLFAQALIASRGSATALVRGDLDMSEKLARDALEIGQRLGGDNASAGLFGLQMFALSRERGKLKELEPLVRIFLKDNSLADTWRPGLAVIYAELGRADEARLAFESLAADDFGDLPHDSLWMGTMTYLVDICVFLGDKPRASNLYRLLVPFDGRNVTIAYAAVCYGAISRYLGMLSTTLEKWDDAARHFEDALTMNARMEAWTWLAHTQFQFAKMLLVRGRSIDREHAFALLDAALATTRRLGMRALEEKASALLNRQS
jgi:tetratricopeptide (TPR) repeat protein